MVDKEQRFAGRLADLGVDIQIIKHKNEPIILIKARDIARICKIRNIRKPLLNFDSSEKMHIPAGTTSGYQNLNYLTYKGMLRLMDMSIQASSLKHLL